MALIQSNMLALGTEAPEFSLLDTVSGKKVTLSELQSDVATVIAFICNHCPFVHHINEKLVAIAKKYQAEGVKFIAISSNDIEYYPQDGPQMMKIVAEKLQYNFPYLYDETQEVAKAFMAECTPDFFVFDNKLKLKYRGRFDETRPNMGVPTGKDMSLALEALIEGKEVSNEQYPSIGCSIKWK